MGRHPKAHYNDKYRFSFAIIAWLYYLHVGFTLLQLNCRAPVLQTEGLGSLDRGGLLSANPRRPGVASVAS